MDSKLIFPDHGCFVCIRSSTNDDFNAPAKGSMISIQLPNGFQFAMDTEYVVNINKDIHNEQKSDRIKQHLMGLINDMYTACYNQEIKDCNDPETENIFPQMPMSFIKKYNITQPDPDDIDICEL